MTSLKLALAGTGKVARNNYLPVLRRCEGASFGFWNRTPGTALEVATEVGGRAFATLAELAEWKPDVVFVLTAEQAHAAVAEELVRAGVACLYLEKPMVADRGQAHVDEADFLRGRRLLELAAASGCRVAMMFNYRFFRQSIEAMKVCRERAWGTVTAVTGMVHYACWSHAIDLIRWFGGEFEEVSALTGLPDRSSVGISAKDLAASFRLEAGGVGTLIGTAGMAWQHPLFELTLNFEGGRLHLRDLDGELEILDRARQTHERVSCVRDQSRWNAYNDSFGRALEAFLAAFRAGAPFPVSGADGLAELRFEAGLRRSVRTGNRVELRTL